jgi:hypothetical protein
LTLPPPLQAARELASKASIDGNATQRLKRRAHLSCRV